MLFDTHAHMDDRKYDADREQLIRAFPEENIALFVNVGADMESSRRSVALAAKYPYAYAAVGVHPEETAELTQLDMDQLRQLALQDKVVAIGEIGLDYHYGDVPKEVQQTWFRRQLELARAVNLPVVIHDREAHGDCLRIVQEVGYHRGVFHCFSGSVEMARQLVALGWYLSFGGTLTFKNAPKVKEAAKSVPIDRILLETDSPYLTPEPFRGRRNQPGYVRYVAEELAKLKEMTPAEVEDMTLQNGKACFGIA